MTVIDLGYPDAEVAAPPRPRLDREPARRGMAGLMVLLCLGLLGASVRPHDNGLHPSWSVDDVGESDFTVSGDTVFVIGHSGPQTLTSRALADGRLRWRHEIADLSYVIAQPGSGVLLLPSGSQTVADGAMSGYTFTETVALDTSTGRERWRVPGSPSAPAVDGTILLEENEPGKIAIARLRLIRLTDGATIWSRETPGVRQWLTFGTDPEHPDQVATVTGSGAVRTMRLADGAVTAQGRVEWGGGDPAQGEFIGLYAHGDGFFVLRMNDQSTTATAYSAGTLRRLWKVTGPARGDSGGAYSCGPVLCMGTGDGLTAYDWESGAVRWHDPGQGYAGEIGSGLLVATSADDSRRALIDGNTGRVIADLGGARTPEGRVGGPVLTIAPARAPAGRTVVRRVDPRTGETFVLGTVDAVADSGCTQAWRYLLCRTLTGKLTVTAFG
jgi:outer membrane protein assembly factor BamB